VPAEREAPLEPFPFVVGCERSGTTLLRLMLDAHPALAVPPESYFIVDLHRRRGRYERRDGGVDLQAVARDLAKHRWFRTWGLDPASFTGTVPSLAGAVRSFYASYAASQGKPRHGDKTPAYVLHLPLLAGLLEEACFVHLIRDGREVALSLAAIEAWGPGSVLDAAIHWAERVRRGRTAGAALGPGRYREVRYDALVRDPESTLRDLGPFLDLPFDARMLDPASRAQERGAGGATGIHARVGERVREGVRDWRTEMSAADLAAVEAAVGDLLEELGYERAVPDPPPEARRRAAEAERARARRHRRHRLRARLRRLRPG
jgi:Sulfotransferase family